MTQLLLSADWLFFKLEHGSSREGFLVRKKVVLTLIEMSELEVLKPKDIWEKIDRKLVRNIIKVE